MAALKDPKTGAIDNTAVDGKRDEILKTINNHVKAREEQTKKVDQEVEEINKTWDMERKVILKRLVKDGKVPAGQEEAAKT